MNQELMMTSRLLLIHLLTGPVLPDSPPCPVVMVILQGHIIITILL